MKHALRGIGREGESLWLLPMAWPGILNGFLLASAFNAGAFAVPLLLRGLKVTTGALVIRDHMGLCSTGRSVPPYRSLWSPSSWVC